MAAVVVVVVVALLHLAVVASVRTGGQDAQVALLRVDTLRAFYLAESGWMVARRTASNPAARPDSGDVLLIGGQPVEFVDVPPGAGVILVEGRSGFARRRVAVTVQ
jgi:hypothetical protein